MRSYDHPLGDEGQGSAKPYYVCPGTADDYCLQTDNNNVIVLYAAVADLSLAVVLSTAVAEPCSIEPSLTSELSESA